MDSLLNLPRSLAISGPVPYSHLMGPHKMFSSETTWMCLSYQSNKILLQNTRLYSSGKSQRFFYFNFHYIINQHVCINQNHTVGQQQSIKLLQKVLNTYSYFPYLPCHGSVVNSLWITLVHGAHFAELRFSYSADWPHSRSRFTNFFCQEPESKYFRLWKPYSLL